MGQCIALDVDAAALPCGAEHLRDGGLDALMSIADHQLAPLQATPGQLAKKLGPDRFGPGRAYFQTQNFAAAVGVHPDGEDDGDRDDPPAAPHLEVGRIDPEIGPVTFDRAVQEGLVL